MRMLHGGDIYTKEVLIDFSTNINPLGIPEKVLLAAQNSLAQIENYPDIYCKKLTNAIAEYEKLSSQYIICGNGAADLIFSLVLAYRPKKALLLAPTFSEYEQALRSVDCSISYFFLQETNEFLLYEDYLDYLTEDLDLVFLCNPNNPTGNIIPPSLLQAIYERCEEKGILLVLDECFMDFISSFKQHSFASKVAKTKYLFVLKAFTKMYAMPGLRLGYGLTGNKELLKKMQKVRQPWSVSIVAQEAGIAALQEVDFVRKSREYIQIERDYLCTAFRKLKISFFSSEANYILLKSKLPLFDALLEIGVLIRDCSNYHGLGRNYFRIAVKKRKENEQLIEALENIVNDVIKEEEF